MNHNFLRFGSRPPDNKGLINGDSVQWEAFQRRAAADRAPSPSAWCNSVFSEDKEQALRIPAAFRFCGW